MKRILAAIGFAAVLVATRSAEADLHTLVLDGQLHVATSERQVTLHLLCEPDPHGGAVSVELWVPEAFKLKDFDYDDFEGPDAPAGNRELSHVTVAGDGGSTEIKHAAAGWYSGEDPDTFVFGLSQLSRREGKVATLLRAMDATKTSLVWVQTGFDDAKRQLRATFPLDPGAVERIRAVVDPCLAASRRPNAADSKKRR